MSDTMQFDLVSPERMLVSGQAKSVLIPGAEGDMVAMPDHMPLITTLRPGLLTVEMDGTSTDYVVTGGFAEVTASSASVLAETAVPRADMTQEIYNDMLAEARRRHETAKETFKNEPGPVDDAAKLLSDMMALGGHIGLYSN